jgi:hypothetical protein
MEKQQPIYIVITKHDASMIGLNFLVFLCWPGMLMSYLNTKSVCDYVSTSHLYFNMMELLLIHLHFSVNRWTYKTIWILLGADTFYGLCWVFVTILYWPLTPTKIENGMDICPKYFDKNFSTVWDYIVWPILCLVFFVMLDLWKYDILDKYRQVIDVIDYTIGAVDNTTCEGCSVCMGEYGYLDELKMTLPCDHMFHKTCLLSWFERQKSCPICSQAYICINDISVKI